MYKLIFSILALGFLHACVSVNADEGQRFPYTSEKLDSFDTGDAESVQINVAVGEIEIIGTDSDTINAKIELSCKKVNAKCERLREKLAWRVDQNNHQITLHLDPSGKTTYNNVNVHILLEVPKNKELDLKVNVGDIDVKNIDACINAHVDIGKLSVEAKKDIISDISLKSDVGETNLTVIDSKIRESRKSLVGSSSKWSGSGSCDSKMTADIGEVSVTLVE